MRSFPKVLIALVGALLAATSAQAGAPSYYLFHAAPLGFPAEGVAARIEIRAEHRVLSSDSLLIEFGDAESLLIPLPSSPPAAAERAGDWRLLVFAGDLLVDDFDRRSFAAYQQALRVTRAAEIATLEGTRVTRPGPVEDAICEPSPCGGLCSPSQDYDCDGVNNANDNCTDIPNWDQSDCDGDDFGDVCDGTNGIFQATGAVKTCMTDKDAHVGYFEFEHHVEQKLVDVSSCHSPDRWDRWVRTDAQCYNVSDSFCCTNGLGGSITAVGDSIFIWCGVNRNTDFCH